MASLQGLPCNARSNPASGDTFDALASAPGPTTFGKFNLTKETNYEAIANETNYFDRSRSFLPGSRTRDGSTRSIENGYRCRREHRIGSWSLGGWLEFVRG